MIRYVLAIAILFVLVALLEVITVGDGALWAGANTLVSLGFLLLIAFSTGELLRRVGLPALLGYIVTGIVLGPGAAELLGVDVPWTIITDEVMADMGLVNVLVVGVIGLLAGVKFRARDLAGEWRVVVLLTAAMLVTIVPLTIAGVLFIGQLFPGSLAFITEQSFVDQFVIAALFGIIAFGLSPSTTVAMIQELRARGPLSTMVLGVVLLSGVVLFSLFTLALTLARNVIGPETLTWAMFLGLIPLVLLDLVIALLLGVVVGVATVLYLRYVGKENLLFTVGLILLAYYASQRLGVEALLVFLTAGVFVQNASEQGEELLAGLGKIGLPVFIVYFATVAASLDLVVALTYLPLVLVLMVTRGLGLWAATHWGGRKLTDNGAMYEGLWGNFIAQDAVVLVLAGLVALQFPEWGGSFQNVVMTTVIVYLIVGPVWLKFGLDKAGETQRAREQAVAELEYKPEEVEELLEVEQAEHLPHPDIQDAWLRGSIEDLREELLLLEDEFIRQPLKQQQAVIRTFLDALDGLVEDSLEKLEASLAESEGGELKIAAVQQSVQDTQKRFFARLQPLYEPIMSEPALAVDSPAMEAMLGAIRQMEQSQSLFKVEREPDLFDPGPEDARPVRYLKALRRLQRSLWGPGHRSVPLGRLWRYYMELSLPLRFARTVPQIAGQNEVLWREIWRHLRSIERFFKDLHLALERNYEIDAALEKAQQAREDAPVKLSVAQLQGRLKRARAVELVKEFQGAQAHRHAELHRLLARRINVGLLGYGANFGRSYRAFVHGASRAGTLELPGYQYRPSALYDQAHRAENRIRERLGRHQQVIAGYRGWIQLDQELVLLSQWFELYKSRVSRSVTAILDERAGVTSAQVQGRVQDLLTRHGEGEVIDWSRAYTDELRPLIQEHRRMLERSMSMLHQGVTTRALVDLLETRVARLAESIDVLSQEPDKAVVPLGMLYRLPLRHWIVTRLTRDIALRFVEFNERGSAVLTERLLSWTNLEQVLEFNLSKSALDEAVSDVEATPDGEERLPAVAGLARVLKSMVELEERRKEENRKFLSWLAKEIDRSVELTCSPLAERRIGEIQRELAKREAATFMARGESWVTGLLKPVTAGVGSLRERGALVWNEVSADVKNLLVEEQVTLEKGDIRALLQAGQPAIASRAPAIYRRLFSPIPLDIPDFYLPRPRAEQLCLQVIREWAEGAPHSLLITGDPGTGKRTLVHHLVPTRVYEVYRELGDNQFQTLRLPDHIRDEADLCAQLAVLLGDPDRTPSDLERFASSIHETATTRRIAIVENGSKIFSRTSAGLELARRFLRMVNDTSKEVFWIVVLPSAAATYLQSALGLWDYFTEVCELEGLSSDELAKMIMARHRVSGYSIEFVPAPLRPIDRLRQPLLSKEAQGRAERLFFDGLARTTAGNPRQALLSWLRALRLDETNEGHLMVEPVVEGSFDLLEELSLNKRLILSQIAQHHAMTLVQLHQVLRVPVQHIEVELHQLARLGFVETLFERVESYQLRILAEPLVHRELRKLNLI